MPDIDRRPGGSQPETIRLEMTPVKTSIALRLLAAVTVLASTTLGSTTLDAQARTSATSRAAKGQYASVNGLRMYYEVHGRNRTDRVPLVLIHGALSTITSISARCCQARRTSRWCSAPTGWCRWSPSSSTRQHHQLANRCDNHHVASLDKLISAARPDACAQCPSCARTERESASERRVLWQQTD
jgi:hypothetical protein